MLRTFIKIFREFRYVALALTVFLVVLVVVLVAPNVKLIVEVATLTQTNIQETFLLAFNLLGSLKTNFTLLSAISTVLVSLLFGVNVSILTYYVRKKKREIEKGGVVASTAGLISGVLGVGCASCGSILIPLLGLGGALTFLPLDGQEFSLIGIGLLVFSVYTLLRSIAKPSVCKVNNY